MKKDHWRVKYSIVSAGRHFQSLEKASLLSWYVQLCLCLLEKDGKERFFCPTDLQARKKGMRRWGRMYVRSEAHR